MFVLRIFSLTLVQCILQKGAAVKMEHFQAALDPRKQELLEARFLGARVSDSLHSVLQYILCCMVYCES